MMCFVLLAQMLGAGTLSHQQHSAHDLVAPLTFFSFRLSQRTKQFFTPFLLFQLVTRCCKSETQTTQRSLSCSSPGGSVSASAHAEKDPPSPSERQLGSLIESYGFASLRYAAAGGMRSFRQPPLSLSLLLPHCCPGVSREGLAGGKSKRYRGNSAHL